MFERFDFHITMKAEVYKGIKYGKHVVIFKNGGCHGATPQEVELWKALHGKGVIAGHDKSE